MAGLIMQPARPFASSFFFCPNRWGELFNLGDHGRWHAGEQIFQIIKRIDSVPSATAQQRVNHGAAFASFGMPNEQPVLFSKGAGSNRIFNQVVINLQSAVGDELRQSRPPFQHVINRLSEQTLGQRFSSRQFHGPM